MKKETIKNKDGSLTTIIDHDLEDGLKISSLNQRIYLSKYNGYRSYDEQFFWLYMEYSNLLNIENYDLEKQDWRSVPFDRVDYLVTPSNKKSYRIKLK